MAEAPRLIALRPLRHACYQCGTCCQGWRVHLADQEEIDRVVQQAAELGIEQPTLTYAPKDSDRVTTMLRSEKGRCVFLSDENLCRIHGTFGSDAKPLVCRQFPRRATRTEDGLRVGIDPACTSTYRSWEHGPEVQPLVGMQSSHMLDDTLRDSEHGLLGLLSLPDMTIPRFVGVLTGGPPQLTSELPVGFVGRVIALLRVADLAPWFEDPASGRDVLFRTSHIPAFLRALDPTQPPTWEGRLTPELDAFAREVLRRHLFLRLGDPELPPIAQTLVMLTGILVCAWADPNEESFPETLAAWSRVMRMRGFWAAYIPETTTARWLMYGDDAPTPDASP